MNVCTITKPATELAAGDIVIGAGNHARYLRSPVRTIVPYIAWEYTTHRPDGSITSQGVTEILASAQVAVVCVTLDGAIVTA